MDSARDKLSGEIVDAEELLYLEEVDQEGYICRGCKAKVIPASFRPENKVRPYFRAPEGHEEGCDVDAEPKLIAKGKKGKLSTERDGFPGSYPDRLILRDTRNVIDPTVSAGGVIDSLHGRPSGGGEGGPSSKNRPRAANTIRPICRTFIRFPYDRHLPLRVPGVDVHVYRQVFKKLKWEPVEYFPANRVFYAAIQWAKPEENEQYLEITLSAGLRQGDMWVQPYKVRIEWAEWSKARRTAVKTEIEIAREEARAATKEGHKEKKGYLFLIGEQDRENPSIFRVHDHRLICCIVDEIIYPKS